MLSNILPESVTYALNNINLNNINEIRLRLNKPIVLNVRGNNYFLTNYGASQDYSQALNCDKKMIEQVLENASNSSLYTINDQLVKGYVTVAGGIRIGVAGDVVQNDGVVTTIKNIKSLNIRVPHDIKNCSLNLYNYLVDNTRVKNTLVISPPGAGKTTFLRDFAYQISKRNANFNLLIVDERNEISGVNYDDIGLDVGEFTDVYSNCTKSFAFENGIRSMRPDVILTDEINLGEDLLAIEHAMTSGVSVVASIHASGMDELKLKKNFQHLLTNKLFDRYVVLSSNRGPGTIEGVYNEDFVCIYC